MKKVLVFVVLCLFSVLAYGQTHTLNLAWDDPNPPEAQVVAYKLYENVSGTWTEVQAVPIAQGQQTQFVLQLGTGLHKFVVTAVNSIDLESDYSNELSVQTNNPNKVIIRIAN